MPTVSINISDFEENIISLRDAVNNIERKIKADTSFEKTNIKPFTKNVEETLEAIELLERYKEMLLTDIDSLENVGQEMRENDEQLASVSGPQMVR